MRRIFQSLQGMQEAVATGKEKTKQTGPAGVNFADRNNQKQLFEFKHSNSEIHPNLW